MLDRCADPRCPTCHQPVARPANPWRPFCSHTCKLIDLGAWLDEAYRVPGAPLPLELEPAPASDATRVGA